MINIKNLCLISSVIALVCVAYYNIRYNGFYEHNYYKELSLENDFYYNDVVSVYGEPVETVCNKEIINDSTYYNYTIIYPDFTVSMQVRIRKV